ncbi:hypothetical protein [Methylophaga frappieri]|uniref:hypothetical protein n=1 Tax=Methylophaga frappieri (strain ATCC BAA-2434 / DSM 25690 / JAM7) TaxID=754477 RepID=UPI00059DAE6A|nr:hypothetical protein [Methylophaga frappieri]
MKIVFSSLVAATLLLTAPAFADCLSEHMDRLTSQERNVTVNYGLYCKGGAWKDFKGCVGREKKNETKTFHPENGWLIESSELTNTKNHNRASAAIISTSNSSVQIALACDAHGCDRSNNHAETKTTLNVALKRIVTGEDYQAVRAACGLD